MINKVIGITIGLGIVIAGGQASANENTEEVVNPSSEFYETTRLMEKAEYELTRDNGEKALLQDEYADERLKEYEVALEEGNDETAQKLMEDYKEHIQEIEYNIKNAKKAGEDISKVEKIVAENSQKRTEQLTALLKREDLPEEAKAGITEALENQEKAMKNFAEAIQQAKEAQQRADEAQKQGQQKAVEGQKRAEEAQKAAQEKAKQGQQKAKEAQSNIPQKPEQANSQGL